ADPAPVHLMSHPTPSADPEAVARAEERARQAAALLARAERRARRLALALYWAALLVVLAWGSALAWEYERAEEGRQADDARRESADAHVQKALDRSRVAAAWGVQDQYRREALAAARHAVELAAVGGASEAVRAEAKRWLAWLEEIATG